MKKTIRKHRAKAHKKGGAPADEKGKVQMNAFFSTQRQQSSLSLVFTALLVAVVGTISLLFIGASTPARTLYVDAAAPGSGDNLGSAQNPYKTISAATDRAKAGDTILVQSGRYAEEVKLNGLAGSTIKGIGATKPIIEGQNTRERGIFASNNAANLVIENFEVTGQTKVGVSIIGPGNDGITVRDNLVHHVGISTDGAHKEQVYGIYAGQGGRNQLVTRNTVHTIGPGGEAMGVMLWEAQNATADNNTVYLVRKDGIRDGNGLDNTIKNNKVFLNANGIAANESTGSLISNNYIFRNTAGFIAKHTSSPFVLEKWGLSQPRWTKFWHNTIYGSQGSAVIIGINPRILDHLQIKNNIFAESGDAHINDFPNPKANGEIIRTNNLQVNGNVYQEVPATPRNADRDEFVYFPFLYYDGLDYIGPTAPKRTLSELQSITTNGYRWETSGRVLSASDLRFEDAAAGDLGYVGSLPLVGVNPAEGLSGELNDGLGTQVGASGLGATNLKWTTHDLTLHNSTPDYNNKSVRKALEKTVDGHEGTTWFGTPHTTFNYSLGGSKTFNYAWMGIYADVFNNTVKNFEIHTSNDGINYTKIYEGRNNDNRGSSYKYDLGQNYTAQYVRLVVKDNFGEAQSALNEFMIGNLEGNTTSGGGTRPRERPPPPPPPPTNRAPTVRITSPPNGATVTLPAQVKLVAEASDPDAGDSLKVEFFNGDNKVGEDTTAPYEAVLGEATAGTYEVSAKVSDGKAEASSAEVTFQVADAVGNRRPTVSMDGSGSGALYVAPTTMRVSARATDPDTGETLKVEFLSNGTLLGEGTPVDGRKRNYKFSKPNMPAGTYRITARVTDSRKARAVSNNAITVVVAPAPNCTGNPQVGDLDCNGKVNWRDVRIMRGKLGSTDPRADIYPVGRPDGKVDVSDLGYLEAKFFQLIL